ncbi:hypothetical protein DLAC_08354 [Tieghemostelium lacteum]|uniref:Transferase family protein n=1 Tax=Tieghemostelium lacteum TaxID=361077 RepID=A0A151ZBY2_TIELA|nr:hypothetical protein DLAC_08354 [Tieghemostelium lacteum]|eukprot:KYQ91394.1 hypothetical protein DLAC_08354 [Tieghemostelium lacteum]
MSVRFFPATMGWNKRIDPLEYFACAIYTRGALYFKGQIDLDRFINAMSESFLVFDFILSTFYRDSNGCFNASYPPTNNVEQCHLEIEKISDSIMNMNNISFDQLLPTSKTVGPSQLSGFAPDLTNLPMGVLKLTILSDDGFVLGYSMNHSLFDQASVFYYLKYISQLYTVGKDKINLPRPAVVNSLPMENKEFTFKNITEARQYGDRVPGFTYTPLIENLASDDKPHPFSLNSLIKLKFDLDEISKIKSQVVEYLSTNDILSGVLFKVYTMTSYLSDEEIFTLRYANNIRKFAKLGEEIIGNLVHQCRMEMSVGEIRNQSILQLALVNRKSVEDIKFDHFRNTLSWYRYMYDNNEETLNYLGKTSFTSSRITNWATFDYDSIKFDTCTPISVKSVNIAQYGVNTIAFDIEDSKKIFTIPISVPPDCVPLVKEYGKSTKLFTTEDMDKPKKK